VIALLVAEFVVIVLIFVRFVHPEVAFRVRDFVVAGMVNKQILVAREGGAPLHRGTFSPLLEKLLYSKTAGSSPQAMKARCLRIREVLGMMSARKGEVETSRDADVGGAVTELADMVHSLGSRMPAGLDDATPVVGADQILLRIVAKLIGTEPISDAEDLEEWFETNRLSVEQISELLIAAIYSLASREELARQEEGGAVYSSNRPPPVASTIVNGTPSSHAAKDTEVADRVTHDTSVGAPLRDTTVAAGSSRHVSASSRPPSAGPARNTPVVPDAYMAVAAMPLHAKAGARSGGPQVPSGMIKAHRVGKLAVFAGSGLSLGSDVAGGFPGWGDLPKRLLSACGQFDTMDDVQLKAELARFDGEMSLEVRLAELGTLQKRLGRRYRAALDDIFRPRDAAPGVVHRTIASMNPRVVLTSNYDQLIELADPPPRRQPYTWRRAADALSDLRADRRILLKVHGSAEDHDSIVMSTEEYQRVRSDASYVAILNFLLQDYTFLFVGYGMNDPLDLDLALRDTAEQFRVSAREHFVLLKDARDLDRDRIARSYNVAVFSYDDHAQVPQFLDAIARGAH
jgi:hypothetical protein